MREEGYEGPPASSAMAMAVGTGVRVVGSVLSFGIKVQILATKGVMVAAAAASRTHTMARQPVNAYMIPSSLNL